MSAAQNENGATLAGSPVDTANQSVSHFNPSYPAHDTQAARLLAVALLGQQINPLQGWISLGTYRLSDTKFRLKEMG